MNQKIVKYSKNTIRLLCQSLDNGNIIAVPTDTVYGLIADAHNENAVNKIFKAKLRPKKLPLIIFVPSLNAAKKIGFFSKEDIRLAKVFWPGDLTLVVKKKKKNIFYGHKAFSTIGIRIPKHRALLDLLKNYKRPLASTSANTHKQVAPTHVDKLDIISNNYVSYALSSLHKIEGTESTIVSFINKEIEIIRKGRITSKMLNNAIKSRQKR